MSRRPRHLVLHPFLLAVYPVLHLYSANVGTSRLDEVWEPCGVLLTLACAFMLLGFLVYRDARPAGVVASAALLVVALYGKFSRPLNSLSIMGVTPFRHRLLVPAVLGVLLLLALTLWRRREFWAGATRTLNMVAGVLVSLALAQAAWAGASLAAGEPLVAGLPIQLRTPVQHRPDIYVIIADEFARADVMQGVFGVDHSHLMDRLRALGFVVARRSVSNYWRTPPSLASFLHMEYLPGYRPKERNDTSQDPAWYAMVRRNRAMRFLRSQGYRVVVYPSGWEVTAAMEDVDLVVDTSPNLDEFRTLLIQASLLSSLQDVLGLGPPQLDENTAHRNRIVKILDTLQTRRNESGVPTFTFVHLPGPHFPLVLHADGSPIEPQELAKFGTAPEFSALPDEVQIKLYHAFYPGQAEYVARRLVQVATELLDRSGPKPIILIASDHGVAITRNGATEADRESQFVQVRFPNLTALYMPGIREEDVDDISLVNTLRLVLRDTFQADLPPLPNRCFFVDEVTSQFYPGPGSPR